MFIDYKTTLATTDNKNRLVIRLSTKSTHKGDIEAIIDDTHIYKSIADTMKVLCAHWTILKNKKHLVVHVSDELLAKGPMLEHLVAEIAHGFLANVYKDKHKVTITHNGTKAHAVVATIVSLVEKVQIARALSMTPANMGTPKGIATTLKKIYKHVPSADVQIFDSKYLRTHGYNLITAVGKGSQHPPCMLVVERKASRAAKTVCVIGKGVTFDTGGLSLKSMREMDGMKYDKCGAIYGAFALLHLMETIPDVHFVGIFPFVENALSATSVVPGDVEKSFIGKTVEITDPDAEGRLILADALGHAHKYAPDLVVDIATLTGHAESISCWHHRYCYVHPADRKMHFEKLCESVGERMLTMPNWTDYSDVLKSDVADLTNMPSKGCSDAFVATLFLKEFVPPKSDWIHIDISNNISNGLPKGNGLRSLVAVVTDYLKQGPLTTRF
jgi:leucyl aminopeptidase